MSVRIVKKQINMKGVKYNLGTKSLPVLDIICYKPGCFITIFKAYPDLRGIIIYNKIRWKLLLRSADERDEKRLPYIIYKDKGISIIKGKGNEFKSESYLPCNQRQKKNLLIMFSLIYSIVKID